MPTEHENLGRFFFILSCRLRILGLLLGWRGNNLIL